MFHTGIDAAHAQPVADTLAAMQASLAHLAASLDARFVQAGNTLATAVDTIDHVIATIDGVVNALDGRDAGAAVDTLHAIARKLSDLPHTQAERESDLQAVSSTVANLRQGVLEMHHILHVLRIYGVNIKIAASGSAEFVGFVDGMATRLNSGEQQLEGFLLKLKELAAGVTNVRQSERSLAGECRKIVPHVPEKLARDAAELQTHQAKTALLAAQVGGIARDVQARVGAVLGALQIGDITRQRLEHVVTGLQLLLERPDQDREDPVVAAAVEGRILRLLAAQLDDLCSDFAREAALLVKSIGALGPDTDRLLGLIESGDSGNQSRDFLQKLESGITEVDRVTTQLRDADEESQVMSHVIANTVDDLAVRLVAIGKVRADVQNMAVNTRLRCKNTGLIGKAVTVIAVEVDAYAQRLDKAAVAVATAIQDLGSVSTSLRERQQAGGQLDPGTALATIREGCQRTERGVSGSGEDARQLIAMIDGASAKLSGELALRAPLIETAAMLTALAGPEAPLPEAADPPLRALLLRIGTLYTMVSERIVHKRFVLPGMTVDTAPPVLATNDEDLFDDALF